MKTSFGCKMRLQTTHSREHGHKRQLHVTGMMPSVLSVTLKGGKVYENNEFWAIFSAGLKIQYFLNSLGASPHGPAGGLTAPPSPPAGKDYDLRSLHMVPHCSAGA